MTKGQKTGGSVRRFTAEEIKLRCKVSQAKSNAKQREVLRRLRVEAGRNPDSVNGS